MLYQDLYWDVYFSLKYKPLLKPEDKINARYSYVMAKNKKRRFGYLEFNNNESADTFAVSLLRKRFEKKWIWYLNSHDGEVFIRARKD